jgi:hypothetical protein
MWNVPIIPSVQRRNRAAKADIRPVAPAIVDHAMSTAPFPHGSGFVSAVTPLMKSRAACSTDFLLSGLSINAANA